jgi:hypothetical protein
VYCFADEENTSSWYYETFNLKLCIEILKQFIYLFSGEKSTHEL